MPSMLLKEFDRYIRGFLAIDDMARTDSSMNGIQVDRKSQELRKVAFAVDASLECFRRACEWGADLVFVHHGLFWGKPLSVRGAHYRRLEFLISHDIALYAAHLPLDMHPELGNNYMIAKILGLQDISPFGEHRGYKIGFKGVFGETRTVYEVKNLLTGEHDTSFRILPFGPEAIRSVGIVAGGAPYEVEQAIEEGLDLYITGDSSHNIYHLCLESGINVIFGGHYKTEIWGAKELTKRVAQETGLATCFIDVPTGL